LSYQQFERIIAELFHLFSIVPGVEITFEGEAASLKNNDLLKALKNNRVARVSFGLQTFDERIRKVLGRTDELADLYTVRERLEVIGFTEVNIDYIYNLPDTDLEFLSGDLAHLKTFAPTSVDCHPLKYVSCSSFMLRQIMENKMTIPDAQLRIAMYRLIRQWMSQNGYVEQFADQYSKKDLSDSNIYMKHLYGLSGGEYIGFGPGARSHFGDFGSTNAQQTDNYNKLINAGKLPVEKRVYAPLADNFITCFPKRNDKLTLEAIGLSTDPAYFTEKLEGLKNQGYLNFDDRGYVLTPEGLNWYQNLQEELLSPDQLNRHMETAKQRVNKLDYFNGYFDGLGGLLATTSIKTA